SMLVTVPDGEEVFSSGGNVTELRELLAAEAGTDKAPPADFLYTNMRSQVNGWQYAFLVPYAQVTRKTQYIISYTLTITGLAVALSILFAGLFSRLQYQPVSRLMKHVARQSHELDGHVSEYTLLEQHIETLSCDRADMQTQLTTQGMELGLENLRRLLLGISYATGSEKEALQRYGVTFEGELFRVVTVAAAEDVMHDGAFFARVKAMFTGAFSHGSVHVLRVMDAICCVISTARPEGDQADAARLREMWNGLAAQVEGPLWMAVSLQHRELLTLPAAYAESTRALQQRTMSETGGLVFYDEAKRNTAFGGIYYPNGFDTRLIHILCSGDLAMMRACVDEVIEQNLRQSITAQQCTYLGYHLCMSFLKAAKECQGMYQLDLSALMEQMVSSLQLDQISALREHYGRLCESLADEIARANRGQEESLIDRIRACVAEHYTDPNLNVNTISDLLSMNASYISRAFADKTGETLSAYLQRIRIEAALPLIRAGQPIAGVMERTGYANVTTFNRAFKKEMGMTPGLYREAERKKSHIDQENEQPSHSSK
ncbi:MAG: helix-turn-helix domain-containing protein, partial [Aristaeellaceae bacterium]